MRGIATPRSFWTASGSPALRRATWKPIFTQGMRLAPEIRPGRFAPAADAIRGRTCRLFQASSRAAAFERVPQPVDPYWKDYLSGYDIPPEDLDAMDQADLRYRIAMGGDTSLDVLWAILPDGDRCAVQPCAGDSMITFWFTDPGGLPRMVLAPTGEEGVTLPVRGPVLPQRPETVFVLGAPSGGRIKLAFEQHDGERWSTVLGEGRSYAVTDAGTAVV